MAHRDTSLAIKQAINYRSQIKDDDPQPVYQTGNNYSLVVNSTELLYQLRYISSVD